jgi:hypothetical protein
VKVAGEVKMNDAQFSKEKFSQGLYSLAGRTVVKYLKDMINSCEHIGGELLECILNINFPIESFIKLTQREAQDLQRKLDGLEMTGVSYRGEVVFNRDDLGRRPSMDTVEQENRASVATLLNQMEEAYGRECTRLWDLGMSDKVNDLTRARDERRNQVLKGTAERQRVMLEEQEADYKLACNKLTSRLGQMTKTRTKLATKQKVQALLEGIQLLFRCILNKLSGILKGEVLIKVYNCLDKAVQLPGRRKLLGLPFTSGSLSGVWTNANDNFAKASIESFLEFTSRRLSVKEGSFDEVQRITSVLDQEAMLMRYGEMPQDLILVANYLQNIKSEDLRKEGIKYLWASCSELKNKTALEAPAYLKSLDLKAKLEVHLASYNAMVVKADIGRSKHGQGHYGGGESDGEEGEGQMADTKAGYGKPKYQSGQKEKTSSPAAGTPGTTVYRKSYSPQIKKWNQVNGSQTYTSHPGPFPLTAEVKVDDNVWVCQNSDSSKAKRYTSVAVACVKCQKALSNKNEVGHNPMCFVSPCNRCKNYGHVQTNCLQQA